MSQNNSRFILLPTYVHVPNFVLQFWTSNNRKCCMSVEQELLNIACCIQTMLPVCSITIKASRFSSSRVSALKHIQVHNVTSVFYYNQSVSFLLQSDIGTDTYTSTQCYQYVLLQSGRRLVSPPVGYLH